MESNSNLKLRVEIKPYTPKMSGRRDPFAPGGREYEKRKMRKKQARRKGPTVSGARAVQARNRATTPTKEEEEEDSSSSQEEKEEVPLSRREREEIEQKEKHEAYLQATREGKTAEGKADLERLKEIRARRDQAARKKEQQRQQEEERKLEERRRAINGGRRIT